MKRYTVEEFELTYISWRSMRGRVSSKTGRVARTWGRLQIHPRWLVFANFLEDMGPRPSRGMTLDRYPDRNGNYEPGNCRWATAEQQAGNTSWANLYKHDGIELPVSAWERRLNLPVGTIARRLHRGEPFEEAIREHAVPRCKLSDEQIAIIRAAKAAAKTRNWGCLELAARFGVHPETISRVALGETYSEVQK